MSSGREQLSAAIGIVGAAVIGAVSLAAAIFYTGSRGEAYSPLNHWISELGEVGVSRLAIVFNVGLMVGGACFAVFMVGLAVAHGGSARFAYGAAGIGTGIGGALVGVFPMNNLSLHDLAALTFFGLGWVAIGLASLDFVRQPDARFPRWLAVIGGFTAAAFLVFLAVVLPEHLGNGFAAPTSRPDISLTPTLEWLVLLTTLTWVFATGWTWYRAERPDDA